MQFSDFFNPGGGLGDTVKIVFFRMLPRGAQIEKVRAEINHGFLKKYGKLTRLEIDRENKTIRADLDLNGEKEGVRITLSNYRLIQEAGKNHSLTSFNPFRVVLLGLRYPAQSVFTANTGLMDSIRWDWATRSFAWILPVAVRKDLPRAA